MFCIILYYFVSYIVSLYTIQNIVFYLYEIDTKYCIDFVLYCIALNCFVLFFNELNCIFLHFSVFLFTFLKLDSVTKQMNIKWVNIIEMVSWTVTWHMLRWNGLHTYWNVQWVVTCTLMPENDTGQTSENKIEKCIFTLLQQC